MDMEEGARGGMRKASAGHREGAFSTRFQLGNKFPFLGFALLVIILFPL